MNFEEFFREATARKMNIDMGGEKEDAHKATLLSNEALFQLPFLAMVILVVSKSRKKPRLSGIGQLVGECLERTLVGFKGTSQYIGWSANLRIRTIRALTFLETSALVEVNARTQAIGSTELGNAVVTLAMSGDGNLAETLRHIERSYRNISAEAQIELALQ